MIPKRSSQKGCDTVPYANEYADKTSHIDIVNNPEIIRFLEKCTFMVEPSEEDVGIVSSKFSTPPKFKGALPDNIISIDGSNYEASIRKDIPCTRIGYVKIGNLLIMRDMYNSLRDGHRFVDPFKVAEIKNNNSAVTFAFPSSNMLYKNEKTVRDSFRAALDEMLYDIRTDANDSHTSIRTTLFQLASYRTGDMATEKADSLIVYSCPNGECDAKKIEVKNISGAQYCPKCSERIYPSDCLRIWEEVSDSTSNQTALTRFMNVIEHIFAVHYIRVIRDYNPQSYVDILSNLCIFIDGPLAIFGNPAWIHSSIMKLLGEINRDMRQHNKSDVMILGLQKTGLIHDYLQLVGRKLPNDSIYCLDDEFRNKYISFDKEPSGTTFGAETYYGQDFLFKTQSGRLFVFDVPYPFPDKKDKLFFCFEKSRIENYKNIGAYTKLIEDFECDLYENAVVPIALAHKYTAISLEPGSRVLDLLSKTAVT